MSTSVFPGHAAFEVLDGQLTIELEGETISLIEGELVFILGNTVYKYYSKVAHTNFMHIGQGAKGLDNALIVGGESCSSPVWPTSKV